MARRPIFVVAEDGTLVEMRPAAPQNEVDMQALVASHPELLEAGDGGLLLISREQGIADSVESGGRWSIDHVFVTHSGIPVLVEIKRACDTRLRREVWTAPGKVARFVS